MFKTNNSFDIPLFVVANMASILLAFCAIITSLLNNCFFLLLCVTEGILRPSSPPPTQTEIEIPEDHKSDQSTTSLVRLSVEEPKPNQDHLDNTCFDLWLVSLKTCMIVHTVLINYHIDSRTTYKEVISEAN